MIEAGSSDYIRRRPLRLGLSHYSGYQVATPLIIKVGSPCNQQLDYALSLGTMTASQCPNNLSSNGLIIHLTSLSKSRLFLEAADGDFLIPSFSTFRSQIFFFFGKEELSSVTRNIVLTLNLLFYCKKNTVNLLFLLFSFLFNHYISE